MKNSSVEMVSSSDTSQAPEKGEKAMAENDVVVSNMFANAASATGKYTI